MKEHELLGPYCRGRRSARLNRRFSHRLACLLQQPAPTNRFLIDVPFAPLGAAACACGAWVMLSACLCGSSDGGLIATWQELPDMIDQRDFVFFAIRATAPWDRVCRRRWHGAVASAGGWLRSLLLRGARKALHEAARAG